MNALRAGLALLAAAVAAGAATVVLQEGVDGYTGCSDTYWYSYEGSNSGGVYTPAGNLDYMELTRSAG